MGITPEQKRELSALASRLNYQLVTHRRTIEVRAPIATLTNDEDGYEEARAYLWRVIKAGYSKEREDVLE